LSFPPRFREHNAEIYGRLGLSDKDLERLISEGVI